MFQASSASSGLGVIKRQVWSNFADSWAPVMGARTCLHANEARRKFGKQLKQGRAFGDRAYKCGRTRLIHAMHCKDVLGEVNSNGYDSHDFPFQVS